MPIELGMETHPFASPPCKSPPPAGVLTRVRICQPDLSPDKLTGFFSSFRISPDPVAHLETQEIIVPREHHDTRFHTPPPISLILFVRQTEYA